jgi:hypothetical protein
MKKPWQLPTWEGIISQKNIFPMHFDILFQNYKCTTLKYTSAHNKEKKSLSMIKFIWLNAQKRVINSD